MNPDWDYVIVGAGSAGCVLANRLSADPANRVILLEAGGADRGLQFRIPFLGPALSVGNPKRDWCFVTEPDPTRNGRTEAWPRGKVLGGSSAINGTIYVRGNRGDYDGWAQSGLSSWSYDRLLPEFREIEDDVDHVGVYGIGGPLPVSRTRGAPELARRFVEAVRELGFPENPAYNGESQLGAAIAHTTQRKGLRYSSARAFLDPAKGRKNLTVATDAAVRRIVFDGPVAVGVEFERGGKVQTAFARREIVLSAGAINSPKLLMLSGVGDRQKLESLGIASVCDAPHVGRNLHEHANVHVTAAVNVPTLARRMSPMFGLGALWQFATRRKGPLTYILPAIAFARTRPELSDSDLQLHLMAFGTSVRDGVSELLDRPAITMQANVNRTRSRGWLELKTADPAAPPLIQPNLLADPVDLQTLVAGGKFLRALLQTKALAPMVEAELRPGPAVQSDAQWEEYVRSDSGIEFHPCGTCRMGMDAHSVVDENLRVRGVRNLRVADAAIIPQIPSANINAIVTVIASKAAKLMLADRAA